MIVWSLTCELAGNTEVDLWVRGATQFEAIEKAQRHLKDTLGRVVKVELGCTLSFEDE